MRQLAQAGRRRGAQPSRDGAAGVLVARCPEHAWLKDRDCSDLIHGDPPIMADVYVCLREAITARATRLKAILARKQFFK